MNDEKKVVWIVSEECHGMVSIWDSFDRAREEVERISFDGGYDTSEPIHNESWNDGNSWGNDFVYTYKYYLNQPW